MVAATATTAKVTTTTTATTTAAATITDSAIAKFYSGKNVLITGASGFLGKVILWKLIDNCPDIGTIYVLLRAKNNCSADKRLIALLKGKPFCLRYDYSDLLNKIVAIESDLTETGLGLSQSDRTLLQDKVNIVLHSAASVKFDAPLKDNLRDNFYGTRNLLDLSATFNNLDAFVHVSTAYSNCHLKEIDEAINPLGMEIEDIVRTIENMPDSVCEDAASNMLEGRPNTYTFTKAMAELYVSRHEGKFPISIVRPSIVISSNADPCPGWCDNVNGITGLGCLAAIGLVRTIDWNYYAISDMVPVDFVASSIICAAHHVAKESPRKLKIFNMTSGESNPISWGKFFDYLRAEVVQTPPTKVVRPVIRAPRHNRANRIELALTKYFSELLFAYLVDTILFLIGYKRCVVKITKKMHHGYNILLPFTSNQWNFKCKNIIALSEELSPEDRRRFKFDMRDFDWKKQAQVTWAGGRQFILKEDPTEESIRIARSRHMYVTILHYFFIVMLLSIAISFSLSGWRAISSAIC